MFLEDLGIFLYWKVFFILFFDTVKNICNKTLTFKFNRKRLLLSEKNKNTKAIGYARATHNEYEYLEDQIKFLKEEGCSLVFSELISPFFSFSATSNSYNISSSLGFSYNLPAYVFPSYLIL